MAIAIHVNGAAIIKVGPQGVTGTPDVLGITEAGPHIDIELHKEGVVADTGGPSIPVDYQKMGKSAKITFALPIYDIAILTDRILKNQAGTNEGQIPALGGLMFGNTAGFRLVITSPVEAVPWRFYYCSVDYARLRPGTKYNIYDIGIDAIPYIGVATTAADAYLYDHVDG